jgi:hypothetical protein
MNKLAIFKSIVPDIIDIDDPWGLGYTWHLHRPGSREYEKRVQAATRKNPVIRVIMDYLMTIVSEDAASRPVAKETKVIGSGETVTDSSGSLVVTETEEVIGASLWQRATDRARAEGAVTSFDLVDNHQRVRIDSLLAALIGMDKDGVPYVPVDEAGNPSVMTDEDWYAVFEDKTPVPEGKASAGEPYGPALLDFLERKLIERATARAAVLEEAEKN